MTFKRKGQSVLCILLCLSLAACSNGGTNKDYPSKYKQSPSQTRENVKMPTHPETATFSDGTKAIVDYSNSSQGYVQARLLQEVQKKVKLKIMKGEKKYFYDLKSQDYETFPLQMGNGTYSISILEDMEEDDMFAVLASQEIDLQEENEQICYLYPNQTVNYNMNSTVVDLSFDLVEGDKDDLTRIYHLYDYVIKTLKYDDAKAKASENEYILPDLEDALKTKKGICYDYAALLAALCRIQNIPAKVIVGDTDIEYHAWVEIYLEGKGWINPTVYFKGQNWSLVDPTFAATKAEYEGKYSEVYHY